MVPDEARCRALRPARTRASSSLAISGLSPKRPIHGFSSAGSAQVARGRTPATSQGPLSLRRAPGCSVIAVLLRVTAPVASRACRCVPAPCSDPDRPTPTRRPPSPSGSRCSGHLDPVFLGILDETSDRLRQVFGTANRRTLPLSATGSAGMEAAFVNTVGPGRRRRRRGQRPVRSAHGRRRLAVRGRGRRRSSTSGGSRSTPTRVLAAHPSPKLIAAVHAETSTGVLLRPRAAGRRQGRRAAAGRLRDLARRHPGAAGRLGRRPRLLRLAEVPGRRARAWRRSRSTTAPGSGGSRSRRAGTSTSGCSAATRARRPARRRDLPPHRADRHGRLAARRARPDPRGGAGRRPRPARRGRPDAARGPAGAGPGAVRRRGAPAAGADHGAGARRRRLGRRPQGAARALRPRDRRRRRAPTRRPCGGSASWARTRRPTRCCSCWPP